MKHVGLNGVLVCVAICVAACTTAPSSSTPLQSPPLSQPTTLPPHAIVSPADAANALIGRFDNAAQFAAAPEALKRTPAAGFPYEWLDEQHARFVRVDAPRIGPDVLYVEWKRADGAISRQRVWSFRRDDVGRMRMDYFSLRTPSAFAGKGDQAGAFAQLSSDDLIGYGPDCALIVTPGAALGRWEGQTNADQCQITGASSGRRMGLTVRLEVRADGLSYAEAGILADGAYAFKVPGGPAYAMQRR